MQKQKANTPAEKPKAAKPVSSAPAGFSGMQPSIMEDSGEMPAEQLVQEPAPQEMQPQPEMIPQEAPPVEETPMPMQEMATIQEPSMPIAQLAYNRSNIEEIESLIESVVEEKWRQAMEPFGDFNMWKEKVRTEIISIKQELLRTENRFENLEKAIIGKVHEYDTHVLNIGAEIKALDKVFQKIVQPLTENIKELSKITTRLKK